MDFTEDFKKTSTFHLLSKQEIKVFSVFYLFVFFFFNSDKQQEKGWEYS